MNLRAAIAAPDRVRRPPVPHVVVLLERFKAQHGDWPGVGSAEVTKMVRCIRRFEREWNRLAGGPDAR